MNKERIEKRTVATKDDVTKSYMSDPARFADMFNAFFYRGKQVIDADSLTELDPTEIADLIDVKIDKIDIDPLQKHRDILKQMCVMTDHKKTYVLLGIENQSHVDRTMVVRVMLYDAMRYLKQFKEITANNKRKKKRGIDYLSGIGRDDTIHPVITLVVNFDERRWDEPTTLHGLFEQDDVIRDLLNFVPDFKMNLYDPHLYNKEDFNTFHTRLKQVFKYIRYAKDGKALEEVVEEDPGYHEMSNSSTMMINVVTDSNFPIKKGENTDMCQALREIREAARQTVIDEKNAETEASIRRLLAQQVPVHVVLDAMRHYPQKRILEIAEELKENGK